MTNGRQVPIFSSSQCNRLIYTCPHWEAVAHGTLLLLTAAAYGLTDSGRSWYLTSSSDLINGHGLERSKFDDSLFYSEEEIGNRDFVLAV